MGQSYRVFISAVTREFGAARDAVANSLQARGIEVEVQRSFGLGDGTTLAKLHRYVRICDRVIAVIGSYSGMFPPEGAVTDEFRAMLPNGMTRASLTQWEVIFARHYRRETYFFEAAADFAPEQAANDGDDPEAQAAWRQWLFDGDIGQDRQQFHTAEGLRADVMSLDWPKPGQARPSNLPSSIGHLFKGRGEFIDQLRESFKRKPATAITGKAVHGLGGVGKTRTAIEYGHTYADEYSATLFLIGKSESDLTDSLATLADAAVLDLPERIVPDLDSRVAAVIRWLRSNPGWLVIIDNVDDQAAASAVRALLDQVSRGGGHVLVTSRVSDWGHTVEPLELDLLSVDAAKELLRESTPNRTKNADEDSALTRLADEQLGCLSLALVQAAAYIDERRIGFADYAALFGSEAEKLLARLGAAAVSNLGYALPVALTWQTSFAQLSEPGRLLLHMLSWLSIEPIPRSLFGAWPDEGIDLEEGLVDLTRYNLIHWETENSALTLHRLVAQVTRDNMDDAGRDRALGGLFPWLYSVNPDLNAGDVRCWPRLLPLLPHALSLFARTSEYGPYSYQTDLYNEYAVLLQGLARYSEAEPLFRCALAIDEARQGPDDPAVAMRLSNLAELLRVTSKLAEAEPLYRRALAIDEKRYGADHPAVATGLNNLALLFRTTNRLSEAEPLYRRALKIDEESYGPDHSRVANRLINLAELLRATDRPTEAEPLFRRALAIDEATYGPDHPEVATDLSNLALLLYATERPEEAEPLLRRALFIDEVSYGPDHPRIAIRLINLAELLRVSERTAEAEPLVRRALAIDEATLGTDHPEIGTDLNCLAGLLWQTNRKAEAEPLFRRAALILLRSSKATGHMMPGTFTALSNYAHALKNADPKRDDWRVIVTALIADAGLNPTELLPQVSGDDG